MVTDCWVVLGIPPTKDETQIRRAYAALVKQYPPHANRDEFRRIREAYVLAQSSAASPPDDCQSLYSENTISDDRNDSNQLPNDVVSNIPGDAEDWLLSRSLSDHVGPLLADKVATRTLEPISVNVPPEHYLQQDDRSLVSDYFTLLEKFCASPTLFRNSAEWEAIAKHPALATISTRAEIREATFERFIALVGSTPSTPPEFGPCMAEMARLLDWADGEAKLATKYSVDQADRFLNLIEWGRSAPKSERDALAKEAHRMHRLASKQWRTMLILYVFAAAIMVIVS